MQDTSLKIWKPETQVLRISSAAYTRIAFPKPVSLFSPRPSSLKVLKLVMADQ